VVIDRSKSVTSIEPKLERGVAVHVLRERRSIIRMLMLMHVDVLRSGSLFIVFIDQSCGSLKTLRSFERSDEI